MLVDAIYLHADWETPFDKESTSPAPFHVADDKSLDVPTMHALTDVGFAEDGGVRAIDLPYKGGDLSMTLLLPDDPKTMSALEERVAKGGLDALVAAEKREPVRIALPKFKATNGAPMALSTDLEALGMPSAFIDGVADFAGMVDAKLPGDHARLHIQDAYHQAFVAIDELGTEAAAATAVVMQAETAFVAPKVDAEFIADHPFLFVLRDKTSGLVLFMGRVSQSRLSARRSGRICASWQDAYDARSNGMPIAACEGMRSRCLLVGLVSAVAAFGCTMRDTDGPAKVAVRRPRSTRIGARRAWDEDHRCERRRGVRRTSAARFHRCGRLRRGECGRPHLLHERRVLARRQR